MGLRASVVGALIVIPSLYVLVDCAEKGTRNKNPPFSPLSDFPKEDNAPEEVAGPSGADQKETHSRDKAQQPGISARIRGIIHKPDSHNIHIVGTSHRIIASWMLSVTESLLVQNYGHRQNTVLPFYFYETAPGANTVYRLLRDYSESSSRKESVKLTNPLEPLLPLGSSVPFNFNNRGTQFVHIAEVLSTEPLRYKVTMGSSPDWCTMRALTLPDDPHALKEILQQQKNDATAYAELMKIQRPGDDRRSSRQLRLSIPYAFGSVAGTPYKSLLLSNGVNIVNFFMIEDVFQASLSEFSKFLKDETTLDPAMTEAARLSLTLQAWILVAHFKAEGFLFQSLKASDFVIDSYGLLFLKLQSGPHPDSAIRRRYMDFRWSAGTKTKAVHNLSVDELRNSYELARLIVDIWCDLPGEGGGASAAAEPVLHVLDLQSFDKCLPWEVKSLVECLQSPSLMYTVYSHSIETLPVYSRLVERLDFAESLAQIRAL